MTTKALWAALAVMTCVPSACAAPTYHGPAASLPAAIGQLNEAYRAADVEALDRLITADYSHTNGGSPPIGREQWLAWNELRAERHANGAWSTDTYAVEELQIHSMGESAVVTGVVRSTGLRDGSPTRVDVRFTALWVLRGGAWRRSAFHDTPIEPTQTADAKE